MRITHALGHSVPDLESIAAFEAAGYHRIGDFLAKGDFLPLSFDRETVLSYVLAKQGVASDTKFGTPLEAIQILPGLRSDMAARLRSRDFEPLERLHRRGLVARGLGITGHRTYCTKEQLQLWKRTKGKPLIPAMKRLLAIIKAEGPLSHRRLYELTPLSYWDTSMAVKRLQTDLHVVRNADHQYVAVGDTPGSVKEARKTAMEQMFRAFGIFSAESFSAYTRSKYGMGETRRLLKEFEDRGILVKGFFVRGEKRLYWMLKEDIGMIEHATYDGQFVLTPQDDLSLYLRESITERWHMGVCYVIFDGPSMVGAFKARRRGSTLAIVKFEGENSSKRILERFEKENELAVGEERDQITDEEVMRWFETMYSKGSTK